MLAIGSLATDKYDNKTIFLIVGHDRGGYFYYWPKLGAVHYSLGTQWIKLKLNEVIE